METAVFLGAGCSFGKETISELIKNYKKVYLLENELYFEKLEQDISILKKEYKEIQFELIKIDVTNVNEFSSIIFDIEKADDKITTFIYAAGINMPTAALNVTEEIWDKVNNVNLKGFFFSAKDVISHMILQNSGGNIVAVASQHGVVANINRAPYCASKAGLIHLVKELALEFAEKGININVISPTFILSDKNHELLMSQKSQREYLSKIPQKKYVTPSNIAKAISFLIDKNTGGITGHNLLIDGGWTIQ